MPSKKPRIATYLTQEEYDQVVASAQQAGLSLSTFVKKVCLGYEPKSKTDHQAVLALLKANADLGRLGGLFKLFLSEGKGSPSELRQCLYKIESTKDRLEKEINTVLSQLSK